MSFLYFFDLLGTFAFAVSGALMGVRKKMDVYGMFVLALLTGVGGGTVRDVLLGRVPPFVFKNIWYIAVTLLATLLVFFLHRNVRRNRKILNIADAVGLGVFTCIGASIAMSEGIAWFGVVLFGVITATVGGMLRDISAQEVPFVLQKEVYASASIAGGFLFLLFHKIGLGADGNIIITSSFITGIRILSMHYGWNLPKIFLRGL